MGRRKAGARVRLADPMDLRVSAQMPDLIGTNRPWLSVLEFPSREIRARLADRCRYRGEDGMKRWVGLGVIADNLINVGVEIDRHSAAWGRPSPITPPTLRQSAHRNVARTSLTSQGG